MKLTRLKEILGRFESVRLLVVGDYFLDQYLVIDSRFAEVSLETGLEARQVIDVRISPGAAGTVCCNLAALGVKAEALGIVGEDGNGYDLIRGLEVRAIGTALMIRSSDRFTPTYIKTMEKLPNGSEVELQRLDIKNRTPTPIHLQLQLIENLRLLAEWADGAIIEDQVQEEDCGVITSAVRQELSRLARLYPQKVFLADSRVRIGEFREVMVKPNETEATKSAVASNQELDEQELLRRLFQRTQRPVFMTCGSRGIHVFDGSNCSHCPAVAVAGPIDIVGAGDSVSAGIASALCSGATLREAAELGNLVASVTIRKLGTTGTATPEEIFCAFHENWQAM